MAAARVGGKGGAMADEIKIVRWQGGGEGERTRVSCGGNPDAMLVHPWADPGTHDAAVIDGPIRGWGAPLCATQFGYGLRLCRCGAVEMVGLFEAVEGEDGEDAKRTWMGELVYRPTGYTPETSGVGDHAPCGAAED